MNLDTQTIDRVVAEVVRRLAELTPTSPAQPTSGAAPSPAPPPIPSATDVLSLDAPVVTTATIHGRLQGIRRVIVGRQAVVTPSVRDELQKRHIRLERQEAVAASQNGAGDLTVVRCTRAADAARAMATLPLPDNAREQSREVLTAAVADTAQGVSHASHVAVLLTDETWAAVCLLNRQSHVRAARARSAEEVRSAIAAIGANVLVIDPRDMTANQWNVALQVFRAGLPRGIPPGM